MLYHFIVFSVGIFNSLTDLSLDGCPPSTVKELYKHRNKLKSLEIINAGADDLRLLLAPDSKETYAKLPPMAIPNQPIVEIDPKYLWNSLTSVNINNCGLSVIDKSFHYLPNLVNLNLSHNSIGKIENLQNCSALNYVNLSYNRIFDLTYLDRSLGKVITIDLSYNRIDNLHGIEHLLAVKDIDLSGNKINDFPTLTFLTTLPFLQKLNLANNPISLLPCYRLKVFTQFLVTVDPTCERSCSDLPFDPALPILDDIVIDSNERIELR